MIELIVALVILSTSMLAVFGTLRMCAAANIGSQRMTESIFLAEKLLVEIIFDEKIAYQTTCGHEGQYDWQIQTAPTGIDNLVAVSIEIEWLGQNKSEAYRLCSLMHRSNLTEYK